MTITNPVICLRLEIIIIQNTVLQNVENLENKKNKLLHKKDYVK